jgi:O-antigen/teichoic acid export membrane protein
MNLSKKNTQPAHRVAINTGILYARMGITVLISLYSTRLVLGALGAENFGIFNVVGGAIVMLTFLNAAMATATQRFLSYAQGTSDFDKQKSIFNVSIVLHIGIAIVIFLFLEGAGYFLFGGILNIAEARMSAAKLIYQFMIVSMLLTIISVPYDAVINSHENMLLYAILSIIESLLKLSIAIYIMYASFDKLIIYGFFMACLSVFLLLLRRIYCYRYYTECHINFRKHFSKPLFKEMTRFAGWSFLGCSSSMLANYGQAIVINIFFGTVVNAAQGIANQVSGQLGSFAVTMQKALNPIIAKSEGAGNRTLMLKASVFGSKVSFFLLMFFFIPVLIEMPYIFKIWLKNVPDYAVIFCRLLLIRNMIEQIFITLTISISAVGNIREYQIYTSTLTFFPLVISYILFYLHYPPYALYIVFILYSLINAVLVLYFARKNCELSIPLYLKTVVFRCVTTFMLIIGLSFIAVLFRSEGNIRLFSVISISSISSGILIWFVGFTFEERKSILQMAKKVIAKIKLKCCLRYITTQ